VSFNAHGFSNVAIFLGYLKKHSVRVRVEQVIAKETESVSFAFRPRARGVISFGLAVPKTSVFDTN
jgi:hypothetical protein